MNKRDLTIILLLVGAVVVYNLLQPTTITSTAQGQPLAGQGTDPFDVSEYTVETLATLGDMV
jgi:hypothetical protein